LPWIPAFAGMTRNRPVRGITRDERHGFLEIEIRITEK
jgi:hypothetical protein